MRNEEIRTLVREGYAKRAIEGESCCGPHCCGDDARAEEISTSIGYTKGDFENVPEGSNLGLGCGNPVALASLKEGETVLDLGSGAGFDCFLAARSVGKAGKVIGVDMTPAMIDKARANAHKGEYANVEFRLGEIEHLPVADRSVDVVLSNCVINLSPEKREAFAEAFRALKPGGRMMVSDIVLLRELPEVIKNSIEVYLGCISGAIAKDQYIALMKEVGFHDVTLVDESLFPLDIMADDPTMEGLMKTFHLTPGRLQELAHAVASIKVSAIKP